MRLLISWGRLGDGGRMGMEVKCGIARLCVMQTSPMQPCKNRFGERE